MTTCALARLPLPASAAAVTSPGFWAILLRELTPALAVHPLLAGAAEQGGRIDPNSVRLSLLSRDIQANRLRLAVFCDEVVGGCSCGDAPHSAHLYLELSLQLDPRTATAEIRLERA